jgi:RND family efflux transporter MFP subunit
MNDTATSWVRRLLILPPLAAGIALLAWQLCGREPPRQGEPGEIARAVRVIPIEPVDFVPRAVGFGFAEPGSVWSAVAQVAGNVVERNPDLEPGKLLNGGTLILRIDPADYQLAVVQIQAMVESVGAELSELAVREGNNRASLEIERRALALMVEDLERKRTLLGRGALSQSTVDEAERQWLAHRLRVQELENQINLIPAQRQVLAATLALNQAKLEEARLDLQRTELRVPFDARIAEVRVEENQFVNVGQVLATADSIDVAEVTAQVPIEQMAAIVRRDMDLSRLPAAEISEFAQQLGLVARVHLRSGPFRASWDARFDRVRPEIDPKTRTVGVVVAVDQPYRQAVPGRKPPLIKNMYVQVDLFGQPWIGRFVIPRVALHREAAGARVYLAGDDDRLVIRPVGEGLSQGDLVVIETGVAAGERLVVSDLVPAIAGMLLAPRVDEDLGRRVAADARGEEQGAPQ